MLSLCDYYIKIINAYVKICLVGYRGGDGVGWGWECYGIVGENRGWRVSGLIEINVRARTLIISKFKLSLVKKCRL